MTDRQDAPREASGPDRGARRRARRAQMTAVAGLGLLGAVAAPWTIASAAHAATGTATPGSLTLSDTAGPALLAAPYPVTLLATDPTTTADRSVVLHDALPPGLSYQAGSTLPAGTAEPTVSPDPTRTGWTDVAWTDPTGLGGGDSTTVSFSVVSAATLPAGTTLSDDATATATTGTGTGRRAHALALSAQATSTVTLQSLAVAETDSGAPAATPATTGAAPTTGAATDTTGAVTDTVTVTDAAVAAASSVSVDVYLPAGLNAAACPTTTVTPAPVALSPAATTPLATGSPAPATPAPTSAALPTPPPPLPCLTPTLTATAALTATASGPPAWPTTAGTTTFTVLHWDLPDLVAGGTDTFTYVVQAPLTASTAPSDLVVATATPAATPSATGPVATTSGPPATAPQPVSATVVHTFAVPAPPDPVAPPTAASAPASAAMPAPAAGPATTITPTAAPDPASAISTTTTTTSANSTTSGSVTASPPDPGSGGSSVHTAVISASAGDPFGTPASPATTAPATSVTSGAAAPDPAAAGDTSRDPFVAPGAVVTAAPATVATTQTVTATAVDPPATAATQSTGTSGLAGTGIDAVRGLEAALAAVLTGAALLTASRRRHPAWPGGRRSSDLLLDDRWDQW